MTEPVEQHVILSRELFDFLMGTGEIDGTSFGELNDGLPGAFWWRGLLRAAERETATFERDLRPDDALRAENARLREALVKAETWFRVYAAQHRAKRTSEGNMKADTNEERADYLRDVLAKPARTALEGNAS